MVSVSFKECVQFILGYANKLVDHQREICSAKNRFDRDSVRQCYYHNHLYVLLYRHSIYPAVKQPNHSKVPITDMREKPVDLFLLHNTGVDFSSRNNFANLCSFAKDSVPVESNIHCINILWIH